MLNFYFLVHKIPTIAYFKIRAKKYAKKKAQVKGDYYEIWNRYWP